MVRFKHRYLLCKLVSDDPHCRLSLEDRVLGGLFRDTICQDTRDFWRSRLLDRFCGSIPQCLYWNSIQYDRRQLLILLHNCTDEGQQEAIQKSVTRSCLLEDSGEEELSDNGGEEAAEAME
uniref:Ribonuclease P/MRP protein subunit POP5 n=1 Tax=Sciurus vulgaris TaxID=55149 RepID=A0A8D2CZN2_SCIVU